MTKDINRFSGLFLYFGLFDNFEKHCSNIIFMLRHLVVILHTA